MHKYLFNSLDPYAKARVILAWNKLSKEKQTAIKNVMRLVDNCDKILQKEIEKQDRKLSGRRKKKQRRALTSDETEAAAVATASPEEEVTAQARQGLAMEIVTGMSSLAILTLSTQRSESLLHIVEKRRQRLRSSIY